MFHTRGLHPINYLSVIQAANNSSSAKAKTFFDKQDWSSAYCNVEQELTSVPLKIVQGKVPIELSGTFYRNGPGRLERGGQWVHHPFDGDGMIAAFRFKNGEISLSNRFVRTEAWQEEEKANRFLYRGVFGTKKPGGQFANAFDLRLKNIANTHVIKLGDQLLALWEASSPHAIDPMSLETHGLSSLGGVLKPGEAFSAHPRLDPGHYGNPHLVTFGVKTGPKSSIRLMEFSTEGSTAGKLISDRTDTFNGFAFLHDFAITPNWALFLQNAINFNPLPFIFGQKGAAQCLSSNLKGQAKFWLIPRESGSFAGQKPRIFNAPDGFVFHHLNAWEKNHKITLESIYYNDFPSIGPNEDFRKIDFSLLPEGRLCRCQIDLLTSEITTSEISQQCCEFAMVNPHVQGLYAQFAWMAVSEQAQGNAPLQAIKKLDLSSGEKSFWSAAPRGFVGEPVMVPHPSAKEEDHGWIIVLVWNGERQSTDLLILKANNLEQECLAELPIGLPHGLHGTWVNEP